MVVGRHLVSSLWTSSIIIAIMYVMSLQILVYVFITLRILTSQKGLFFRTRFNPHYRRVQ